jgi:serine/threonine-protein kinase
MLAPPFILDGRESSVADLIELLRSALTERYRIDRELGSGGMAVVFLGEDLRHHRRVAVKVLRPELAAVIGSERFVGEIETAARLSHPHILPLHDSGSVGELLYYVMPYAEGESLRQRLDREKQLGLGDALRFASEIADALDFAHRRKVVHRDIKPENILLEENHAVVADFGIARVIDAVGGEKLTTTGLAIGTPAYMSPEQVAGNRDLDGRSDVYSLGCVLYEMLVGTPPFTGVGPAAVLARHVMDAPPSPRTVRPSLAPAVERVILKAARQGAG